MAGVTTAIIAIAGFGSPALATSESYGKSDASTTWQADSTRRCYFNGQAISFTTSTDFANGGQYLRAWDNFKDFLLGTSSLMNVVSTNYAVGAGPSGQNQCGFGYNGFYLDYKKHSSGSDNSFSGTLFY